MGILTPYAQAWAKFRGSAEYKKLREHITDVGDPYAQNRIRIAFDAGWNAKTSSVLDALNSMTDRGSDPGPNETAGQ